MWLTGPKTDSAVISAIETEAAKGELRDGTIKFLTYLSKYLFCYDEMGKRYSEIDPDCELEKTTVTTDSGGIQKEDSERKDR